MFFFPQLEESHYFTSSFCLSCQALCEEINHPHCLAGWLWRAGTAGRCLSQGGHLLPMAVKTSNHGTCSWEPGWEIFLPFSQLVGAGLAWTWTVGWLHRWPGILKAMWPGRAGGLDKFRCHWNVEKGLDALRKSLSRICQGLCRASEFVYFFFTSLATGSASWWNFVLVKARHFITWRQRKQDTCQLPCCLPVEILLQWVGAMPGQFPRLVC